MESFLIPSFSLIADGLGLGSYKKFLYLRLELFRILNEWLRKRPFRLCDVSPTYWAPHPLAPHVITYIRFELFQFTSLSIWMPYLLPLIEDVIVDLHDIWWHVKHLLALHVDWSDFVPNSTFYRIWSGFHRIFATGVACRQGTLTPPDTWCRPFGTCIYSSCWDQSFSECVVILPDYALRISLGTFSILLHLHIFHYRIQEIKLPTDLVGFCSETYLVSTYLRVDCVTPCFWQNVMIIVYLCGSSITYLPINAWFWGYYVLIVLLWEA